MNLIKKLRDLKIAKTDDRWVCPEDDPITSCSWIPSFNRSIVRFALCFCHNVKQYKQFKKKCNCYDTIESAMSKISSYRILFIGTPHIASITLEKLIENGFNIVGVITQEDKPTGRKKELTFSPVKQAAINHDIPVYQPHRIRKEYEFVRELNVDLILTLAYGQIIPHDLLTIPKYGCLNLHGSLLPAYRGAAPIQRAILNGETKTGITLMEMVDEMDAGGMFAKEEVEISPEDNYTTLVEKMAQAATKICLEKLSDYFEGKLIKVEQDKSLVTFADKILKEDEKLSLDESSVHFVNHVRALADEPGAYLFIDDKKLKIYQATLVNNVSIDEVGKLYIKKGVFLRLKDGVVRLTSLQLEGKKRMDDVSFSNGFNSLNNHFVK